ncbi:Pseudouridine-5'-phosphate glycosidase [Ceratocystis fimbriata CBS 114723]|uniref:Pseudouridine-5'-phosphate glycosidase n=1 Tax=Ceratocystis fimbriata CBS 114723 TaxID=1035309 RepID=A0A2C5X5B4_9PEZI|nr:Pseudouridine-5'-phosphate glycosidase [Ceratocystis fimbriata CBS 114723]
MRVHLLRSAVRGRSFCLSQFSPSSVSTSQQQRWSSSSLGSLRKILHISDEVAEAIATKKPVVALESTIYTHGALQTGLANELEQVVRQNGGIPATIGLFAGKPTVGLTPDEIETMIAEGGAMKVSRRDIAYLAGMGISGRKIHGGTTIAGTMILARLAGIRVFGTGGLGGVHRGGETSLDISADLTELGRTRVAVVSSGCKGFLDIPRTLEFLETQGVLVSTFADGRTGASVDFPAFWARESGSKSPSVVTTEAEAAAMILAQENLGLESGLLFANPIPTVAEIPKARMEGIISTALREAEEKGFTGNKNTPYVLDRIRELTGEDSVRANLVLVNENVKRATKIAVELAKLETPGEKVFASAAWSRHSKPVPVTPSPADHFVNTGSGADILVAGSVALDLSCDYMGGWGSDRTNQIQPQMHTSNPACINQSVGGVGHNVALAAHLVSEHTNVRLCSLIGDDVAGTTVLSSLRASGLDTTYVRQLGPEYAGSNRTAQYVSINDGSRNLVMAMADMGIFTHHSFPDYWKSAVAGASPRWVVVDGNWSETDIRAWIGASKERDCYIAFEPVSTAKASRLFGADSNNIPLGLYPSPSIDIASPNNYELKAMFDAARANGHLESIPWFSVVDSFNLRGGARDRFVQMTNVSITDAGIPQQTLQLLPYIPTLLTKLGSEGVLLTQILTPADPRLKDPNEMKYILSRSNDHPLVGGVYMRLFPPAERVENVVSVNGVGDTFLGVLIAGLAQGGKVQNLVDVAQKAAVMTLKSHQSVNPDLRHLDGELKLAVTRK